MFRHVLSNAVMLCLLFSAMPSIQAAEPFDLPDCAADFASEVVLNATVLDAMIPLTEPGGARPNREHETLFIMSRYYLQRLQALLLIPRGDAKQQPLLLTAACAPYPEATAHIRTFFATLNPAQTQALIAYRDRVWPPSQRTTVQIGAMVQIPAGDGLSAFAIEITEVTNAQYRQFMEAGGYATQEWWTENGWAWLQAHKRHQPSYWDNEQFNAPQQPAVGVTWFEADAYCRWAGKTLPSEVQWEKACRGEDGRKYPWGNEPLSPPQAATASGTGDTYTAPSVVGSMPQTQSPYGVQDMAGNVLEWTQTVRDGQMLLCGGSGNSYTHNVGCGVRYSLLPGIAANFIGFRCQSAKP